jgi:hypothetical protein
LNRFSAGTSLVERSLGRGVAAGSLDEICSLYLGYIDMRYCFLRFGWVELIPEEASSSRPGSLLHNGDSDSGASPNQSRENPTIMRRGMRCLAGLRSRSESVGVHGRSYPRNGARAAVIIAMFVFAAAGLSAQAPAPSSDQPSPQRENQPCQQTGSTAASSSQAASQSSKESPGKNQNGAPEDKCVSQSKEDEQSKEQTNRILWVVPNFAAVGANKQLPPLSVKGKFWLATEDTFDYSSFVWTGILAGQEFSSKTYPEFHQGMAGYGRYYYHVFIDGVSGSYFTEAIFPSITHEDPRYYTLGHGGFLRRAGYALSRVVITKTDSEGSSFNWSEIVGNLFEAGLSTAYYPAQERGARQTAINWGAQIESAALNNIAKEFWPDIHHFLFHRKEPAPPPQQ